MPKRPQKPHPPRHRPAIQPSAFSLQPSPRPTHWANVAGWYDHLVGDQGSEYHQHVILPGILRMLQLETRNSKQETPLRILDLACGQGVLARKLASLGHQVTALDAAAPLIDAAKKRNESDRLPITYHLADATKLLPPSPSPLSPDSFDAATIILAIQNMTPLSPIWQAVRLALKPGGSLILVMMHPCFRIPQHSDWHWDEKTARQARLIYDYLGSLKIEIVTHPGQAAYPRNQQAPAPQIKNQKSEIKNPSTTHFHRPLQAYINTLGNAGLLIDHIEEWPSHKTSQPGPRQKALDQSRKEIPLFLALRARKTDR